MALARALGSGGGFRLIDKGIDAIVLQSGDHDDRAAQRLLQAGDVDGVAVLFHQVCHVEGDHHGQTRLDHLKRQVQVALQIGGVNHLHHNVRLTAHEVVARHLLFRAIRRQRIDAREVRDDNAFISRQGRLLFLDRNARPISHVAVLARNQIEQRGFTAVGITRQRDMNLGFSHHSFFHIKALRFKQFLSWPLLLE